MKYTKKEISELNGIQLPNKNIGADPEFFLLSQDKVIESAKVLKKQGENSNQNEAVDDGFQAELHIEAATCRESAIYNLSYAFIDYLNQINNTKIDGISLSPVVTISDAELKALSKKSMQFHCAPSQNPYNEEPIRVDAAKHNNRYAGGHLHFEVNHIKDFDPNEAAKMMDLFIGLSLPILTNGSEKEALRRKYYGRAGEYRYSFRKGIFEYRVPSCFWLKHPAYMSILFDYGRRALKTLTYTTLKDKLLKEVNFEDVQNAINLNNRTKAIKLYDEIITPLGNISDYYICPIDISQNMLITTGAIEYASEIVTLLRNWGISGFKNKYTVHFKIAPGFWSYLHTNNICAFIRRLNTNDYVKRCYTHIGHAIKKLSEKI